MIREIPPGLLTPNPLLPSILNQDGGDASNVTWPFLLLPRSFLLRWTDCSKASSSSIPKGPWVSRRQAEAGCTSVQTHCVFNNWVYVTFLLRYKHFLPSW